MNIKEVKTREVNITLTINEAASLYHTLNNKSQGRTEVEINLLDDLGGILTNGD